MLKLHSGWKKGHKASCEFVEDTGQLMMAPVQAALLATVLLFALPGSSSSVFCPESCSCQTASLLNCSLSGLTSVPQLIPDSVSELDFSHNYLSSVNPRHPRQNLRNLWLGNNTISHLSLCVERHVKSWHRLRTGGKKGCQGWAPNLQMLSVERNQLERLPLGLGGVPSLRVLWLAFNKISVLKPGELSDLRQLEELHLQHNLITHLHPQMFQDLIQLRVLDVRFNSLTILHPLMYLNLRNIGAHVGLDGNRWKCDCNLRSLRRRMAHDNARGLEVWKVMCASPSRLLGIDLLQLKEEELQCLNPQNTPDVHQDVTVYRGSQLLLSCSAEDSVWWMPGATAPVKHKDGDLLITDISETNTGLYVCVSEKQQVVSVFNLQISQIENAAETKSLPRNRREISPQSRAGTTQSNLALAVCLSVIITFLVAFILGVVSRPYIELLWKRITTKKGSSASNSVSSVEQRHYENAAFSDSDEAVVGGPYRERRVTFRNEEDIENTNVQYYDTVASSDQNSVVSEEVFAEEGPNTQESEFDQRMQQMNVAERQNGASAETTSKQIHQVEFEHIPDPDELENKSLSSSSDSSSSDNEEQITKICHTTPKSPLLEKETIHKRANSSTDKEVLDPQVSTEIPGFSSEPFADWSPHSNKSNSKDELFDFSDSPRSTPARPNSGFAHTLDKQKSGDTSSSSSSDSGEEHTQDILHSKQGRQKSKIKTSTLKQSRDTSTSDESTNQETKQTKTHKLRKKWPSIALWQREIKASTGFSTSSSSDSDDETKYNTEKQKLGMLEMRPITHQELVTEMYTPDGGWPTIDVQSIPRIKRRLNFVKIYSQKSSHNYWMITHGKVKHRDRALNSDSSSSSERENMPGKIKTSLPSASTFGFMYGVDKTAISMRTDMPTFNHSKSPLFKSPSHSSSSSSNSESDDDVKVQIKLPEDNKVQMVTPQHIKDLSGSSSSSSSKSEDEIHRLNQRPKNQKAGKLPLQEPQPKDNVPHSRWPTVNLLHVPQINRRLDFKVSFAHSSSSISETNDRKSLKTVERPTFQTSPTQLVEATSQSSSSSSSSESEDDKKVQIKPLEQNKVPTSKPQRIKGNSESSSSSSSENDAIEQRPGVKIGQLREPPPKDYDPHSRWPSVDLLHVPHITRRLDFKVPLSHSLSSSSDNIEGTTSLKKVQKPTLQLSTSAPVKAPLHSSSSSSSSSETDDNVKVQIKQLEQNKVQTSKPQRIKIISDSSSSSNSDSDYDSHRKNQRPVSLKAGQLPFQESPSKDYDPHSRWPSVDLLHIPHINKRLDFKILSSQSLFYNSEHYDRTSSLKKVQKPTFQLSTSPVVKAPSHSSSSSSSSESDDDVKDQIKPLEQNKVQTPRPQQIKDHSESSSSSRSENYGIEQRPGVKIGQLQEPPRKDYDPQTRWPTVDLTHVPHINRRLDFKVPLSHSSSSSRDNIDRTTSLKKVQKPTFKLSTSPLVKAPSHRSSSSSSSESDVDVKVQIKTLNQNKVQTQRHQHIHDQSGSSSSSNSESEDDSHRNNQRPESLKAGQLPFGEPQSKDNDLHSKWPTVELLHVPHITRRLDFKVRLAYLLSSSSDNIHNTTSLKKVERPTFLPSTPLVKSPSQGSSSSSRSESDNDIKVQIKPLGQNKVQMLRPQQMKYQSESSSSSSSESDDGNKQRPGSVNIGHLQNQEPRPKDYDPHSRWPIVDLLHVLHINRRLDFKIQLSHPSSYNNENFDTTASLKKVQKPTFPLSTSPLLKAPSHSLSSSTSSESEDDITVQIKPFEQKKVQTSRPQRIKDHSESSSSSSSESDGIEQRPGGVKIGQLQEPRPKDNDPQGRWPTIDLLQVPHINRRLDFKVPLSHSSSAISETTDRTTSLKKVQKPTFKLSTSPLVKAPSHRSSSSSSSESDVDVKVQIKPLNQNKVQTQRHQHIKNQSGSSSSSNSESDEDSHRNNQRPESLKAGQFPIREPQSEDDDLHSKWPTVELLHVPHITRRLDFKVQLAHLLSSGSDNIYNTTSLKKVERPTFLPSTPLVKSPSQGSSLSSRSESDNDIKVQIKPLGQNKVQMLRPQQMKYQSESSSSSSSESDDGNKQRPGSVKIGHLQNQEPRPKDYDPHSRWPIVDLLRVLHINRRLDFKIQLSHPSSYNKENFDTTASLKKVQKPTFPLSTSPLLKAPSHSLSSSTSSESEDDITVQIKPLEQKNVQTSRPQRIKDSESSSSSSSESDGIEQRPGGVKIGQLQEPRPKDNDPQGRWPTINLLQVPHINRRLDFKVPLSHSSSAISETTDRTTSLKKVQKPTFKLSTSPLVKAPSHRSSSSSSSESDVDVKVQIKPLNQNKVQTQRHQHIKDQSGSSSSSNSESDEDSHRNNQRPESLKAGQFPIREPQSEDDDLHSKWPTVELLHVPHITRRLDFKIPLSNSASSSSNDKTDRTTSLKKVERPTFQRLTTPLDKAPTQSSSSSSSSETEDDTESHRVKHRPGSVKIGQLSFREPELNTYDLHGRWPTVDLPRVPYIPRRLDFKIPLSNSASSSSNDNIDRQTTLNKVEKPTLHSSASSQSSTSSSSSESDDETMVKRKPFETLPGSLITKEENNFTITSSALNIHYPPKNTPNIILQKYVTFEDNTENQTTKETVKTSSESNLDLHRRWATMNLGISRFRKHLEISSHAAPKPNLMSPTPYSPGSDSSSEVRTRQMSHIGIQEITHTDSSVIETKPNILRMTVRNSGSSSSTEEEEIQYSLPDLSLGVPRIKRRLDVKVLSPKMSSSSSPSGDDESDSSSKQKNSKSVPDVLSLAGDSAIFYKRSIIKPLSLYNSSRTQAMDSMNTDKGTIGRNSAATRSPPHLSIDEILIKQNEEFRLDTHVPLSPIRRTGVSLGVPSPFMNKETKAKASLQQVLPENLKSTQLESNINNVAKILQDNRKPVTLGLEYSSFGSVNVSSSIPVNSEEFGSFPDRTHEASKAVFEDRKEMRGFRALTAMSLARRKWDADPDRDESPSSDDHILYGGNETDRALSEAPSNPPFASENEKRVLDLLYGVPSYRSHGNIKPPKEAPPPVPPTPSSHP